MVFHENVCDRKNLSVCVCMHNKEKVFIYFCYIKQPFFLIPPEDICVFLLIFFKRKRREKH